MRIFGHIVSIATLLMVCLSSIAVATTPASKEPFELIPEYAINTAEKLKSRSAIYWADELPKVPILLVHAKDDKRVSYKHSEMLAEKLKEHNRDVEFISVEEGGHGFSKNRAEVNAMVVSWFKTHLKSIRYVLHYKDYDRCKGNAPRKSEQL